MLDIILFLVFSVIKKLLIRNFKSIVSVEIDCKRLNILIGPPNSGKSNILEAIGLLSYVGHPRFPKIFLRTNMIRDLFYDRDISRELLVRADEYEFQAVLKNEHIGVSISPSDEISVAHIYPESLPSLKSEDFRIFRFYRFRGVGTKTAPMDYLLPPDGENMLGMLLSNTSLRKFAGSLFGEFGYTLVLKPDESRIEIMKIVDGVAITFGLGLVSDTLLRILFNFAIILTNRGSVIAIEEPETHAFPFYVKLLAESIAMDDKNQYFISTHNPYFAISLIEKSPTSDINVIVVEYKDYQTRVNIVAPDKLSEILDLGGDIFFNLEKLTR